MDNYYIALRRWKTFNPYPEEPNPELVVYHETEGFLEVCLPFSSIEGRRGWVATGWDNIQDVCCFAVFGFELLFQTSKFREYEDFLKKYSVAYELLK